MKCPICDVEHITTQPTLDPNIRQFFCCRRKWFIRAGVIINPMSLEELEKARARFAGARR